MGVRARGGESLHLSLPSERCYLSLLPAHYLARLLHRGSMGHMTNLSVLACVLWGGGSETNQVNSVHAWAFPRGCDSIGCVRNHQYCFIIHGGLGSPARFPAAVSDAEREMAVPPHKRKKGREGGGVAVSSDFDYAMAPDLLWFGSTRMTVYS